MPEALPSEPSPPSPNVPWPLPKRLENRLERFQRRRGSIGIFLERRDLSEDDRALTVEDLAGVEKSIAELENDGYDGLGGC